MHLYLASKLSSVLVSCLVSASEVFITVYDSMCSSTVTMLRLFMELEIITPF